MIDLMALRKPTADALSRQARAEEFDLAPWRQGPKHRAIVACIPWRAGWTFGVRKPVKSTYSVSCLRQSLQVGDARAQELQQHVLCTLQHETTALCLSDLNQQVLAKCRQLYPVLNAPTTKPSSRPRIVQMVDNMWRAHRLLHRGDQNRTLQGMIAAWRRAAGLQKAGRELRQACREECKAWFEEHIQQAEVAASKHDIGAVYRVINKLASRKPR